MNGALRKHFLYIWYFIYIFDISYLLTSILCVSGSMTIFCRSLIPEFVDSIVNLTGDSAVVSGGQ